MEYLLKFDAVEIGEVVIRSLFSLITLFLVTKMLGKKQVSQLSLFDYVIGISIGNFAAEISINVDTPYVNGIVAVLIFGIVAVSISYLTMKSMRLRRFFMGTPTLLIQNGKILEKNLKKVKFDINDMLEECRNNDYFDISEIEYAIMEANGHLSILPKFENKPLTPKDMGIKGEKNSLCANVIIDSKYMYNNLKNMHKTKEWLDSQLKIKGYSDLSKILLATLDINYKLTVYERNYDEKPFNVLE